MSAADISRGAARRRHGPPSARGGVRHAGLRHRRVRVDRVGRGRRVAGHRPPGDRPGPIRFRRNGSRREGCPRPPRGSRRPGRPAGRCRGRRCGRPPGQQARLVGPGRLQPGREGCRADPRRRPRRERPAVPVRLRRSRAGDRAPGHGAGPVPVPRTGRAAWRQREPGPGVRRPRRAHGLRPIRPHRARHGRPRFHRRHHRRGPGEGRVRLPRRGHEPLGGGPPQRRRPAGRAGADRRAGRHRRARHRRAGHPHPGDRRGHRRGLGVARRPGRPPTTSPATSAGSGRSSGWRCPRRARPPANSSAGRRPDPPCWRTSPPARTAGPPDTPCVDGRGRGRQAT